jgi:hypothetical protein
MVMLNGAWYFCMVKKGKFTVFKALLYDIQKAIEVKNPKKCPLEEMVPEHYYKFLPLFSKVIPDWVPPYRPGIEHEVCLQDRVTPT